MILQIFFISKGHILSRDYALKTILRSEGTLSRKGVMVLRTLLILKGHKKEIKRRKIRQHKSKRKREEKISKFQKTFRFVE